MRRVSPNADSLGILIYKDAAVACACAGVLVSKDNVRIPRGILLIFALGRRTHLWFNNGVP